MKKLVSIVLALIMVFSLATVAFAEGETQDYSVLKGAAEFAWGIYQDHICQHKLLSGESAWIAKGWTDRNEAAYTHTEKYVCALCGAVKYEEHNCTSYETIDYTNNGMTIQHTCLACGNTWTENQDGHVHHFKVTGYGRRAYNGIYTHYLVYGCECGYTKDGIHTLCLPLTDKKEDGYLHNICCAICGQSMLAVPTVEQVIRDVTDNIKAQALEAAENAINAQITKVLETVYNSLTQEQQTALENLWNAVNFVVELWTDHYWEFNADNSEV